MKHMSCHTPLRFLTRNTPLVLKIGIVACCQTFPWLPLFVHAGIMPDDVAMETLRVPVEEPNMWYQKEYEQVCVGALYQEE